MNTPGPSRAADLAAQQVEQIVRAAETAAQQIREEASAEGSREALRELESARKEAKAQLEEAEKESAQIREQTERAVEGRVAAAEKAAAEVLEEAHALHSGMRRLGEVLSDQAERILRDVQAAHRRMQADLRVSPVESARPAAREAERPSRGAERPSAREAERPSRGAERPSARGEREPGPRPADLSESERIIAAAEAARSESQTPQRRRRANPFDDLDVPSWVGRDR